MIEAKLTSPPPPFSLALVTGASSGIGAALCHLLAKRGIALLMTGRDQERLQMLAEQLRTYVPVSLLVADLNETMGRKTLIEKIYQHKPDLIINNAGFGLYGEALSHETKAQLEIVNVNALAVLEVTLESARVLIEAGKAGVILNVSSAADRLVFPGLAAYAASKAFVTQLSQSLDYEMRPQGVCVLAACPGMVATAFRKRASNDKNSTSSPLAMSPEYAAAQVWRQIESRQLVYIFDWKTRLGILLARFLPQKWLAQGLKKSIASKREIGGTIR